MTVSIISPKPGGGKANGFAVFVAPGFRLRHHHRDAELGEPFVDGFHAEHLVRG